MSLGERLRQPVTLPRLGRRPANGPLVSAPEGRGSAADGADRTDATPPDGDGATATLAPPRPRTSRLTLPSRLALPAGLTPARRSGRRDAPVAGVRLDVDAVRVAAVTLQNGRPTVRGHATAPLAEGAIREGEVAEPLVVGAALRAALDRLGAGDRVRLGVANQRVAARTVLIPPVEDPKEIEAAVRFVAGDQLPVPLDGAVMDHVPLDVVTTEEGARRRVLVVAARREMIDGLLAAAEAAGARVVGIDLGAFALVRALPRTDRRLIVDLGGVTTLAIAEGMHCTFVRTIGAGIESAAAELADREAMPVADAVRAVTAARLGADRDDDLARQASPYATRDGEPDTMVTAGDAERHGLDPHGGSADAGPVDGSRDTEPDAGGPRETDRDEPGHRPDAHERDDVAGAAKAGPVLERTLRAIGATVRHSLDYHRAEQETGTADVAVCQLSGPLARVPGVPDLLEAELGMPVEPARVDPRGDADALAAGLCLAEVPA